METIPELIKTLIRFKSTHDRPDEICRCADFIGNYLKSEEIPYSRIDRNGIPSIVVLPKPGYARVLLVSHIDVVEGPDALFQPVERDGSIFGRGSIDDKYAVAVSLVLLKNKLASARQQGSGLPDLSFGVLITGDEEIGGHDGVEHALSGIKSDFGIVLDGGGLDQVVVKEKGILRLKLVTPGCSAHSARPWMGDNAIDNLIADYASIRSRFSETAPDHWHPTLNFSRVGAGQSENQVPDRAEAIFDIRYTEKEDPDRLVETLSQGITGELTVLFRAPVFDGGSSPYLDLLKQIVPSVSFGFEHGASDARHLSERKIPSIVWGADGNLSQHSADEHVAVQSVFELYGRLDAFLEKALSIS